jgi:hypothetical protein
MDNYPDIQFHFTSEYENTAVNVPS